MHKLHLNRGRKAKRFSAEMNEDSRNWIFFDSNGDDRLRVCVSHECLIHIQKQRNDFMDFRSAFQSVAATA